MREKQSSVSHVLRKVTTKTGIILLCIVVVLAGIRIALPYVILHFVNQKLNTIPGYDGHVADLDLHIYRGAYVIKGIELTKSNGAVPVPFFSAQAIDLSVEWASLLHGALVAEIRFINPIVNFVEGKSKQDSQTSVNKSWQETLKSLFPLRINSFKIENGQVHFRSFTSKPNIDVFMHNIFFTATNLTNSEKVSRSMVAHLDADGRVLGEGKFSAHMDLDPYAADPTFNMAAELTNVDLSKLNDFLLAYGKFDVEQGTFGLYMEFAAAKGRFEGYIKPLFENLKVVSWNKDKKNPAKLLWESIVGAVAGLFTNKPTDRLATRIPLSGSFKDPSPDIWATVANLLRNAFVRAIMPGLDQQMKYQDVGRQ